MCLLRRLLTLCLCSLLYCSTSAATDRNSEKIKLYFGVAEGNYLIGDLRGAERTLQEILKSDPQHLPSLRLLTRVQLDQNQSQVALETTRTLLKIDQENAQNTLLHALVLGHLDRRTEAIEVLQTLLKSVAPESKDAAAATQMLGLFQMAESDWDAAAQTFYQRYKSEKDPSENLELATEAYLEKAQEALDQNKAQSALDALDQALTLYNDQSGQTALQRRTQLSILQAQIHSRTGNLTAAIRILEPLIQAQPDNQQTRIILASLYASTSQWDALNATIAPIKQVPEFADIALYFEGREAYAEGRIGTARIRFQEALDQLPEGPNTLRPSLHFYLGACYEALDRSDEANQSILEALDTGFRPELAEEAQLSAQVYARTGDAQKAIKLLEAILLNQADQSANTWQLLGRMLETDRQLKRALSAYNQALDVAEPTAETLGLRGALLRKLGDLPGAESDFLSALELQVENSAFHYALGLIYFQSGRLEKASQRFTNALELAPKNSDLQLLNALLLFTTGQTNQASLNLDNYIGFVQSAPNSTAHLLRYFLKASPEQATALQTLEALKTDDIELRRIIAYISGKQNKAETLNAAAAAESPSEAQKQICATAFWMAQHAAISGQTDTQAELLQIAVDTDRTTSPEYQCALWQLKQL